MRRFPAHPPTDPTVRIAESLLKLGELDAALSLCQETIHATKETGEKWSNTIAHRTLGEIISCREPLDAQKAEQAIMDAIRIQKEINAKPELARSYVSYGKLLKAKGETERAKEYLAQAIDMFQQMGMKWDLAQAEQVLQKF